MQRFIQTLIVFLSTGWFILSAPSSLSAQEIPFYQDIAAFRQLDSLQPPPSDALLLIGSSSFTMWKDVQDYFPAHRLINRGFGGSTLTDVLRYAPDIITPYQARQIIVYCGENDLAEDSTADGYTVYHRWLRLFGWIRERQPAVPVAFISLKPSPSRRHLWPKMREANRLIRNFMRTQEKAQYIDVYNRMMDGRGQARGDIFIADSLHMNARGYRIWQKAMAPHLLPSSRMNKVIPLNGASPLKPH